MRSTPTIPGLASVTKVMTMLLIMEALEGAPSPRKPWSPSPPPRRVWEARQVYMKEGESFSVHDMLKAIAVASGNDACVAMAEYLAGSEHLCGKDERQSGGLGMENTVFVNCTGLPAEGHHSSAYDIALMSRALIQNHPDIAPTPPSGWTPFGTEPSSWPTPTSSSDSTRATGLKTGSTDAALYCVSRHRERTGWSSSPWCWAPHLCGPI